MREEFSDDKGHGEHYRAFVADLSRYGKSNESAWFNIRKRMYERAL